MNIGKVIFNKYWKHSIFLLSINPLINIFINMGNKRKIIDFYLKNIGSIRGLIFLLLIVGIFYFSINKKRYKRLNFSKMNTSIFAILSVIFSIANNSFAIVVMVYIELFIFDFVLENRFIDFEEKKSNKKETIYSSRKNSKHRLIELLENKENNSLILIDGEWGIGKTFFVDRILEEIKDKVEENKKEIIPVKVDVLLFNDKNNLIKFVLEEINKILLENGIRSKSIGKYLEIMIRNINTIPNKSIKTVLSVFALFYDENYENIEKFIKEDIKELENKEIIIIVDNLERTLDEKITIDILGFLHYIYEKLNLKIIVLADSSKLKDEIGSEDYLKKFFIDTIILNFIDYREIIKELPNNDIFIKNQDIQEEIVNIFREKSNELKNGLEEILKKEDDLEKNRKELIKYETDYYKIMSKFENPRSYQSIRNIYIEIKNQINKLYEFSEEKLKEYENLILRMAFYKEIYGTIRFEKTVLKETHPLTYYLLYPLNKVRNEIEENLTELLNNSNNEILNAKKIIEEKNANKNIEDILKNFKIYFDVFYKVDKKYKINLLNYYSGNYTILKEKLNEEIWNFYNLDFKALVHIDRMYYVENGNSIVYDLFKNNGELRYRQESDSNISEAVKLISEDLIKKVKEFRVDEAERHYNKFNNFYMCYETYEQEPEKVIETSLKIIADIKDKNSELNNLEKKYLEYFIELFELYFSVKKYDLKNINEDFDKLKYILEKIKKIREKIKELSNLSEINKQIDYYEENEKYKEIYKEFETQRNILMSSLYYPLESDEYFKKKVEVCLEIDKYEIKYDDNNHGKSKEKGEKFSDYYKKIIMRKKYLRNLKFEEIINYREYN